MSLDQDEVGALKARLKTLATEKVYIDIVVEMIHRLCNVSGLDSAARAIMVAVSEAIGGAQSVIYYKIGDDIYRVTLFGGADKLSAPDDPQVSEVFLSRRPIEVERSAGDTKMLIPEFSKAWTWIFPLVVGDDLIGVYKVENLHLGARGLMRALPLFFEFAALILKNEILSQSNLKRAYDELRKAHEELIDARNKLEQEAEERSAMLRQFAQANRQLESRSAELEQANRELASFYRTASHDLRTPLRAVDGFSKLLLDGYGEQLDDEGRRLLMIVRKNVAHTSQLIDDLLAFSRLSQMEMKIELADMAALSEVVAGDLRNANPDRDITTRIGALPPALCDKTMIQQALVNLIGNAVKFTAGRDNAVIEIGGAEEEQENVYWIKDNGAGFDMRYAHKLFGVFERLHSADEFGGTGIGLAIVKRIIERHGGRVWAESQLNQGAIVHFTLPKPVP